MIYEPVPSKKCRKCGEERSIALFFRDKGFRDGHKARCVFCDTEAKGRKAYRPLYRATEGNKRCCSCKREFPATEEHFYLCRNGKLSGNCKVCAKRSVQKHRGENPEHYRAYMQMYHQSDKHQQWKREYRKTPRCRELDRQRAKRYAAKYPEKKKRYNSRWAKENRPYTRAAKSKRRALLANAPGAHTCDSTRRQYDQQDGRCYWCSEPLNGDYHEDHVVPLSRGGSNWSINIVCACSWCNLSKHNKLPYIEWQPPCPLEIF